MRIPRKPFPSYKWRWAVLQPTESLNRPEIFFGVLKALSRNEGERTSSEELREELYRVEEETNSNVHLARTGERNLIRNSGQYWKALGLLLPRRGIIELTELGRQVASGAYSEAEFASAIVTGYALPNSITTPDAELWYEAGLRIYPLKLILEIVHALHERNSLDAYITSNELINVVIPLAGDNGTIAEYCDAILQYRRDPRQFANWPNCAPDSNDPRMAREFLLFLYYHGFLQLGGTAGVDSHNERYLLADLNDDIFEGIQSLNFDGVEHAIQLINETGMPSTIERRKVQRNITERPQQQRFKRNVEIAYQKRCLVTGVSVPSVLQAAHIIPVPKNGNDRIENGLLLRSDIHILYDVGHLKIQPSGLMIATNTLRKDPKYDLHGKYVQIPDFVNKDNLRWRVEYTA